MSFGQEEAENFFGPATTGCGEREPTLSPLIAAMGGVP